jgi:hypothetical protein
MDVQMGDGFASIRTVVDHDAVAVLTKSFLTGGGGGCGEKGTQQLAVG